jgi:hypothetical protein
MLKNKNNFEITNFFFFVVVVVRPRTFQSTLVTQNTFFYYISFGSLLNEKCFQKKFVE